MPPRPTHDPDPRPRLSRRTLLALPLAIGVAAALRAVPASGQPVHLSGGDVAAGGYDVVAYFARGEAVRGSRTHQARWNGATWRFSSAENRDAFVANPARYAPAYGGFCAWAAAENYLAPGDPRHWRIVDGRLFLNFNASVHRRWERDVPGNVARADANWPGLAGH